MVARMMEKISKGEINLSGLSLSPFRSLRNKFGFLFFLDNVIMVPFRRGCILLFVLYFFIIIFYSKASLRIIRMLQLGSADAACTIKSNYLLQLRLKRIRTGTRRLTED